MNSNKTKCDRENEVFQMDDFITLVDLSFELGVGEAWLRNHAGEFGAKRNGNRIVFPRRNIDAIRRQVADARKLRRLDVEHRERIAS
jgi:hypothetical protein